MLINKNNKDLIMVIEIGFILSLVLFILVTYIKYRNNIKLHSSDHIRLIKIFSNLKYPFIDLDTFCKNCRTLDDKLFYAICLNRNIKDNIFIAYRCVVPEDNGLCFIIIIKYKKSPQLIYIRSAKDKPIINTYSLLPKKYILSNKDFIDILELNI